MYARLNHVTKVSTFILNEDETAKVRRWFEKQIKMEWPDGVDDNAAVEDALKEIIEDDGN
jgi:hypothetical protein